MSGSENGARPSPGEAVMDRFVLVCHAETPSHSVQSISVEVVSTIDHILLTFTVVGVSQLVVPAWTASARADGLWKTTCFELFLAPIGGERYFELNFSPSSQWAAYQFEGYRAGMRELPMTMPPHVDPAELREPYVIEVDFELNDIPFVDLHMGLSAVIEETDGTKSYWALAHAPGPPDFHNRDCFIAPLPAPNAA